MKLSIDNRSLFEKLYSIEYLKDGFRAVKKNKGSPGIDGVTIEEYDLELEENLNTLHKEIKNWEYKPFPVKQIDIPKPGKNAGVRKLGIPCVRDRVVQATLKMILEPIFEPHFSDNSYGFRPHRSQQRAIKEARKIIIANYIIEMVLYQF